MTSRRERLDAKLATLILFGSELAHDCDRDGHPPHLVDEDGNCAVCTYWTSIRSCTPSRPSRSSSGG